MKMLLLYILLVAFGCQQTPFLESENLKTSETEKRLKAKDKGLKSESRKDTKSQSDCDSMSQGHKVAGSQGDCLSDSATLRRLCDSVSLRPYDFYESQIRLADSLYKNYLPQYNFEEVKKAVEFLESENLKTSKSEKRLKAKDKRLKSESRKDAKSQSDCLYDSATLRPYDPATAYRMSVDCCPLSVDIEFLCARAHYYHAVGLTERDDIVGTCEHYFIALEIMESETENLKTSKSEKGREQRAMSHEQKFRNAHSSKLEAQSTSQFFSFSDSQILNNPEDYEKIRFLSLIYTRLGELFLSENYCDLAISKYRKALKYKLLLGENKAVANTYKCLGNSYHLYDMPDSALYYYNKSLATNSELPNRLDVEKCIAQILFDRGEKDSAYIMIKNNLDKIENVNIIYSYYNILGDMYINDKEYDCAIYYLDKSMNSTISDIRVYAAIKLSSIYNIIGDNIKKAYYDNIVSKILIDYNNSNIETSKLQYIYDRYKERKSEKEKSISRMRTKVIAVSLSVLVFITFVITILILRKSKRKDKYIASKEEIISNTNEKIKQKESEIKKLIEAIERYRTDINSLRNEMVVKEQEISGKESVIKNMEDDLSAKEGELKKLQENIHEYMILINNLNEDNIAKKKQIKSHLEEIENNRQVINDKDRLISIAAEGLITRKDAIAENRNETARLQAIIGENDMIINRMSKDYKTNEELIAIQTEKIEKLKTEINETRNNLDDLRFRSSSTEGRIKSLNAELKKKEDLIKKFTAEISNLRYRLERNHIEISNLNNYLQSEVCTRILKEIKELSENNMDTSELTTMSQKELVLLLNSANFHLNHFMNDIANKYSRLKKEDLYYLCLVIIGLNNSQISSLLGVTYTAVRKRKNKICKLLGLDIKENLYNHLLNLI